MIKQLTKKYRDTDLIKQNQFNLLVYEQGSIKNTIGRSAKEKFFQFLGSAFCNEKIFTFSMQRRKTSDCFSTVYLFSL